MLVGMDDQIINGLGDSGGVLLRLIVIVDQTFY